MLKKNYAVDQSTVAEYLYNRADAVVRVPKAEGLKFTDSIGSARTRSQANRRLGNPH